MPHLPRSAAIALAALAGGFSLLAQTDNCFGADPSTQEAPPSVLAASLPSTAALLTNGTARQRSCAIALFFEVARRPDGAVLLKPHLPAILASLRDPERGIVGFAEYILLNLFPQPVDAVVPYLLDYVKDQKIDEEFRAGAVGTLVWYAPDDPTVVSSAAGFLKGNRGRAARAEAIHDMGLMLSNAHRYSPALVDLIANTARNDRQIRLEAIEALGRCGWKAFAAANPILVEIAQDQTESDAIRRAAKTAVEEILQSPRN